jgi:triosephosphate isomerase (TIM)
VKRILAGNWKMNLGLGEARALLKDVAAGLASARGVAVVVFPSFTLLGPLASQRGPGDPRLGAQNCHSEPKGAFTGEISAEMLRDAGAEFVLIGHSERRRLFGESDAVVQQKLRAAWRAGITPLLCIGETLAERERRETQEVLARQIRRALDGAPNRAPLWVAYEPVWAIGTGVVATAEQVAEAHAWVRAELEAVVRDAREIPVLYGGSVEPLAARALSALGGVDGFLVGGASLKAESFLAIGAALEAAASTTPTPD